MNKYNLVGLNNSPVTSDNFREANIQIRDLFPSIEKREMGSTIRESYDLGERDMLHVYYGIKKSEIFIPKNKELVKDEIELKTKLKLEEIK